MYQCDVNTKWDGDEWNIKWDGDFKKLSREETNFHYSPSRWSRVIKPDEAVNIFCKLIIDQSVSAKPELTNCEFDVAYGDGERESVEILKPDDPAEDAPVLIFFHGGLWQEQCKEEYRFLAPPFLKRGAIVVLVGYTLCPKVTVATTVNQCERATAFIAKRFPKASGFYTSGHSCGGHLSVMMLSVDWTKHQLPNNLITGAGPLGGVFDVRPYINTYNNEVLKLTEDEAWEISPLNHVQHVAKHNPESKVYVIHGTHDCPAYKKESRDYYQMLLKAGIKCKIIEIKDCDHFELLTNMSEGDEGTKTLIEMMSLKD